MGRVRIDTDVRTLETKPHPTGDATRDRTLEEYVGVLLRNRFRLTIGAFAGALALYLASFLMTPVYKASVTLIPMAPKDKLGSLGAFGIDLQSLGVGQSGSELPPAMYPQIVQSRAVTEAVLADTFVTSAGGDPVVYEKWLRPSGRGRIRHERAIKLLRDRTSATVDRRTGTITISVQDRDALISASSANAFAARLQEFVVDVLASHAGQRRRFIENRRQEIRAELSRSEDGLRQFREQNVRIGNSPRLLLEESRLARGVRELEEVYLTLSREYEMAKVEENRDVPVLATLDVATPPVLRSWPRRAILAGIGFFLGGGVVLVWAAYRRPFEALA